MQVYGMGGSYFCKDADMNQVNWITFSNVWNIKW